MRRPSPERPVGLTTARTPGEERDEESTRQAGAARRPLDCGRRGAPGTGVLVGAPHTSNWDFVMMLLIMWRGGVTPRVLIKKELFRGPFGWLLHRLGGLPLDRENPGSWCDTSCARPAAASRSCSSSRRREPARRASTGSRASGALRGQRTCRSPLPSSTAPPAQRDSAPPSRPRPTWSLTWTRSGSSTATSAAFTQSCGQSPRLREELRAGGGLT